MEGWLFLAFVLVCGCLYACSWWRKQADIVAREQAEKKVMISAPILEEDIEVLQRTKSPKLLQAVHLWGQQLLHGRHPEAEEWR